MAAGLMENDLSRLSDAVRSTLKRKPAYFIGNAWISASQTIPVVDPSSGRQIAEIARGGASEIDAAVQSAHQALHSREWSALGPVGREALLHRLAGLIEAKVEDIAHVETIDNGMPLWFSGALDVAGSAGVYRYYAGWPTKLTGETFEVSAPPGLGEFFGLTRREPVGVIGAITPWNVPFMLAAWKLAPALAAGCTIVLKPAEDASLSSLLLAELVKEAGFPAGVVNIVTGYGREAGEALVTHPKVAKISFTGSTATGRHIAALAGRELKRTTLELGGKAPTIVFDDAELDEAALGAANSIFFNSGQICVAGSRLYLQEGIHDAVLEKLRAHVSDLKVGPGLDSRSAMGPLINSRQRDRVHGYIRGARNSAREVFSGEDVGGSSGFYVSPTVVTGAQHEDAITQEEVFGPVLSVYRFKEIDEVIAAANGTTYGLAASIFSRDIERALAVVSRLECGKISVNSTGFPYPALPEGGYKASGYGRDLGKEAIEQCLQTKTVLIKTA